MQIKAVLFDLDGTLLPIDQDEFVRAYFKSLSGFIKPFGYDSETIKSTVIKATFAMVNGDGTRPNEEIFWEHFCGVYGEKAREDKPCFDRYYEENFDELKIYTSHNPQAAKTVKYLREKGIRTVLATNPLFPRCAIEKRLSWAGLSFSDFCLCTTYENSSYCKPNPDYYREILGKIGCEPHNCIMVGNDVDDDMVAKTVGIDVFLLTDCLINRNNKDTKIYPQGGYDKLMEFIKNKIEI